MTNMHDASPCMTELHYRHTSENCLPAIVILVAFILAFFSFVMSGIGFLYSAIWQSLVMICGAVGIYFGFRYYLSYRTYTLTSLNSRAVLIVTDTQGRRISTVCHIYLDEVEELYLEERGRSLPDSIKKKKPEKHFSFTNSMRPQYRIRLYAHTDMGYIMVLLGSNQVFYQILTSRTEYAKQATQN